MATRMKHLVVGASMAVALALVAGATTSVAAALRTIQMFDQCDPDTFNAAFGDDTCVGNAGGVKLDVSISQLIHHGAAGALALHPGSGPHSGGAWSSSPRTMAARLTRSQRSIEFGGGFVDELNDILGLTPDTRMRGAGAHLPSGLIFPDRAPNRKTKNLGAPLHVLHSLLDAHGRDRPVAPQRSPQRNCSTLIAATGDGVGPQRALTQRHEADAAFVRGRALFLGPSAFGANQHRGIARRRLRLERPTAPRHRRRLRARRASAGATAQVRRAGLDRQRHLNRRHHGPARLLHRGNRDAPPPIDPARRASAPRRWFPSAWRRRAARRRCRA